jgi:hypothetical protein
VAFAFCRRSPKYGWPSRNSPRLGATEATAIERRSLILAPAGATPSPHKLSDEILIAINCKGI